MISPVIRGAVALGCALGIWWSCRLIRADILFRQDTPQSIREAIRLNPDEARYYIRLSQIEEAGAVELLETALRMAPFQADAAIELGLRAESSGDYARAEKLLLQAAELDRAYLPRWTLANFYFRRNQLPAFWTWARRAAGMPADDIAALFELCWRLTADGEAIGRAILGGDPSATRQYVAFLLAKKDLQAAAAIAPQLIDRGEPLTDRALLLALLDRLIAAADGVPATALWRALADRRWVVADAGAINNPGFDRPLLPVGFDWRLASADGLSSSTGPAGLEVEFSGKQPEFCVIAEQIVPLSPGQYTFLSNYRTSGIPSGSGLIWSISDLASGFVFAKSTGLSSENFREQETLFTAEGEHSLVRVRLEYRRAIGASRISGILAVKSATIRTVPAHDLPKMQ